MIFFPSSFLLPSFFCACEIDGKVYGEGIGQNKQMAKSAAAKQAYEKLMIQPVVRVCIMLRVMIDSLMFSLIIISSCKFKTELFLSNFLAERNTCSHYGNKICRSCFSLSDI